MNTSKQPYKYTTSYYRKIRAWKSKANPWWLGMYVFDKNSSYESVIFWRCEERGRCKTSFHTKNWNYIKAINEQSHGQSPANSEVQKIVTRIKYRVENAVEATVQGINECITETSQAAEGSSTKGNKKKKK